jgi:FlgD Ig-like domain/Ser-Thr-rich glycosyl-phosphatidyl-inositol-anchored membrane family
MRLLALRSPFVAIGPIWLALLLSLPGLAAAGPKALFDNTHAETAGNADWVIDDNQPVPVPDQSTITEATSRTIWLGAISSWGVDLVKRGYTVATLTSTYGITYGNNSNPYDLSNYDVFIVAEPNTRFSSAESLAIFNYVRDGGGLVAISDHDGSDRNSDGFDSPRIWDRLDSQHFFGVHFDTTGDANNNISQNSGNYETSLSDSITNGPNGVADSVSYHNGTTMILYPAVNASVKGDIWINGQSHGTTNVMAAHAVYGNGRIGWVGDSSPVDDGSAEPGNSSIFDGWGEAGGRDSLLLQNMTQWVTRRTTSTQWTILASAGANGSISPSGTVTVTQGANQTFTLTPASGCAVASIVVDGVSQTVASSYTFTNVTASHTITATFADVTAPTVTVTAPNGGELWLVGTSHSITWTASDNVGVTSVDIAWSTDGGATYPNVIATGVANTGSYSWSPTIATASARVRVTAHDAASNSTADASNANFATAQWTILATAGANGSIAPSGTVTVAHGANQTFTLTPAAGCAVASIVVDGVSQTVASSYTFTNVTANHTIAATFVDVTVPTVTVTAPNGGEYWPVGSSQTITWTASDNVGVTSVDLYWSSNGGLSYTPIVMGISNTGSYTWSPPDPTSMGRVRVSVYDAAGNNRSDDSNANFVTARWTIVASAGPNGSIAPSGNVTVNHDENQTFTLTPAPGFAVASIVVDGTSQPVASSYTFTAVSANHTIAATFADVTPPTVTVTSPNGGETWTIGTSHLITWTATDNAGVASVDIAWSTDGGATYPNVIASGVPNSGSYSWSPDIATTTARVRVTATDAVSNAGSDASDADFTTVQAGTVTLLSPDGGEHWHADETRDIQWTSQFVGSTVDLDLSVNGAAGPWVAIQHGVPNTGDYSWLVANVTTDSALVRVTGLDGGGFPASDSSHAFFSIVAGGAAVAGGPPKFALANPAPNPSHAGLTLRFSLAREGDTRLEILDLAGRRVRELLHGAYGAGSYSARWDGRDGSGAVAPPGLYLARLTSGNARLTTRLARF